jgi:hypothetical protein
MCVGGRYICIYIHIYRYRKRERERENLYRERVKRFILEMHHVRERDALLSVLLIHSSYRAMRPPSGRNSPWGCLSKVRSTGWAGSELRWARSSVQLPCQARRLQFSALSPQECPLLLQRSASVCGAPSSVCLKHRYELDTPSSAPRTSPLPASFVACL